MLNMTVIEKDVKAAKLVQDHADMVKRLAKPGKDILEQLTPEKCHMLHMAACAGPELAELFDGIKKHIFYNKPLTPEMRANLVEELGDARFYMKGIMQAFDITEEEVLEGNINKLDKLRYPNGYSDEAAQARADKEEVRHPEQGLEGKGEEA